ncbi:TPA: hypothetical protein ACP7S5_004989, partial [Escherichia coli]
GGQMKLLNVERELLMEARVFIEAGTQIRDRVCRTPINPWFMDLDFTIQYLAEQHGTVKHRMAAKRLLAHTHFSAHYFLTHKCGYRTFIRETDENGVGWIRPGNVTEQQFQDWCALVYIATIDRILDEGEKN